MKRSFFESSDLSNENKKLNTEYQCQKEENDRLEKARQELKIKETGYPGTVFKKFNQNSRSRNLDGPKPLAFGSYCWFAE